MKLAKAGLVPTGANLLEEYGSFAALEAACAAFCEQVNARPHAGRRTIVKALNSADPPARKKIHREPTALKDLHGHIDAMIEADPAIATATIWQRLADDHGVTVAYPTLRTYVTSRRAAMQPPPMSRLS